MPKSRKISFRLYPKEMFLIKELERALGQKNISEVIRLSIFHTYLSYKSGLFRFIKPMPEIAKEIIKKEKT